MKELKPLEAIINIYKYKPSKDRIYKHIKATGNK